MNNISRRQNQTDQLIRLAAQRRLYSDAKQIQALHMFLSVPCVIVASILVAFNQNFQGYAALWGILVALGDVTVFTPLQKSRIKKAAKIQELFDCDVLEMEWNTIAAEHRPETEDVVGAANRYKKKDPEYEKLKNWYPPQVDKLPKHLARIVCQRINCWWDAQLRRRYANIMLVIVTVLAITVILIGLIDGLTVEKFLLAILLPLMPVILLGLRQSKDNRDAANRLDKLRKHANALWDRALNGQSTSTQLDLDSRKLQDEIYIRRSQTPLIFDWIYHRLRDEYEEQMNVGASTLIDEALKVVTNRPKTSEATA